MSLPPAFATKSDLRSGLKSRPSGCEPTGIGASSAPEPTERTSTWLRAGLDTYTRPASPKTTSPGRPPQTGITGAGGDGGVQAGVGTTGVVAAMLIPWLVSTTSLAPSGVRTAVPEASPTGSGRAIEPTGSPRARSSTSTVPSCTRYPVVPDASTATPVPPAGIVARRTRSSS